MASISEINRLSSQVTMDKIALNERNRGATTRTNKANATWKGRINNAFKDYNRKTQIKMTRLLSDMGNLRTRLNSLATAMSRAERENQIRR